ncbi:MAG: hypothetical protein BGO69_12560 [Bacteroidetes bacterium 46-16]|nr:MAG: hypothetical protein BGO69_12560 [Bacteroidetes bacterium 46-16]
MKCITEIFLIKFLLTMFEIRSYTRKELAMLYFPKCLPAAAYMNFRRWMLEQKSADELLTKIHRKKILSKSEVKEIVDILGEP